MTLSIFFAASIGFAEDSDMTRATLAGLKSVRVSVENMQPNIQAYADKYGLTIKQIQSDLEQKLTQNGIKILTADAWLTVPGRPVLYININTHETEKYWYAYNIKMELRQLVSLKANPEITTLAATWFINITGIANIGNLHIIKSDLMVLVDRFLNAYQAVNK
ncbi:MAG: hypothetical protein JXA41_08135 [Deltaproteobacteria bacterium]|nr:hypothetical protein [Deltaproteobacteria bacterium]